MWIGLIAFSVGIVAWANFGNLVPSVTSPASGWALFEIMGVELVIALLILGGALLMALGWEWRAKGQNEKKG